MYRVVHASARLPPMATTQDGTSARERLLAAAIEYVSQHGVGEISLRGLAAALGTSHRMLIYHFGSREALLIEVIRTVEEQQRAGARGDPQGRRRTARRDHAAHVGARRRPGAVAERAPVLRGLRPGAAGEPARAAAARRHRRRLGRAAGGAGRARPPEGGGPRGGAPRRRRRARPAARPAGHRRPRGRRRRHGALHLGDRAAPRAPDGRVGPLRRRLSRALRGV